MFPRLPFITTIRPVTVPVDSEPMTRRTGIEEPKEIARILSTP